MSDWDQSDWEKPYSDKYKILVIDPEKIVVVIPLSDTDCCWAIFAGIKEIAKNHIVKNIIIQGKGNENIKVIVMIEPKLVI